MALRRARHGERSARAEEPSLVIEAMDLAGIGEGATLAIERDRIVFPGVPVSEHDLHEFVGAVVAQIVFEMLGEAEVGGLRVVQRSDDVPGSPAVEQQVDRGKHARDMERFVVGRRVGDPDPEFFGGKAHGESDRHRIELCRAYAVPHRLPEVIAETIRNGEPVIEEGEMKFAGFERAADVFIIFA